MHIAVILPAAGSSRRYAQGEIALAGRSKLDEDLGGRPVLHRSVELFANHPDVRTIIVAGPADNAAFAEFKDRHGDRLGLLGVRLCQGGAEHRYQTVQRALELVPAEATHVAVHDAARPATPPELIERVFQAAAQGHAAVIPGLDVPDTLKKVDPAPVVDEAPDPLAAILGGSERKPLGRHVDKTVDRVGLVGVQTPQVFKADLLRKAYAQKNLDSTDDAQLIERLGERVLVVEGDPRNLKITRAPDIVLVRAILGFKAPGEKPAHLRF